MLKMTLPLGCCLLAGVLCAQEIPYVKAGQITRWKTAETDTVYVLNFWATWCAPCVEELPVFEKLNADYAEKKVQVVLINTDFKKQVDSKVKPFVKRRKLKSRIVFMDESNPNKWINLVNPDWSGAIPATLIVSPGKKVERFFEKQLTYGELEKEVAEALKD